MILFFFNAEEQIPGEASGNHIYMLTLGVG
jgi:hypothetical protein